MQQLSGRERRRKGLGNRLRRLAYGAMLVLSAPSAFAAPDLAPPAKRHMLRAAEPKAQEQQTLSALVFLQALAADQAAPAVFGASFSRAVLGERSEQALSSLPLPLHTGLVALSFSDDDLRRLRHGAGLDISLPDLGEFHLNFFSRGHDPGRRWSLNPVSQKSGWTPQHNWTLGGSFDLVRTRDDGPRQLVFVPQLVINAAAALKTRGKFDICIQYAYWNSRSGDISGRLPQALVRLSF